MLTRYYAPGAVLDPPGQAWEDLIAALRKSCYDDRPEDDRKATFYMQDTVDQLENFHRRFNGLDLWGLEDLLAALKLQDDG